MKRAEDLTKTFESEGNAMEPDDDLQAWYRGLGIVERSSPPSDDSGVGSDGSRANLREWQRAVPALVADERFAARLAEDGLTMDAASRLLDAREVSPKCARDVRWISILKGAYRSEYDAEFVDSILEVHADRPEMQLLHCIGPVLNATRRRFRVELARLLDEHEYVPILVDHIEKVFFVSWSEELREVLLKTLVLEMNVARVSDELPGGTPEERFSSFVASLKSPERSLALLREYPVLARQVVVHLDKQLRYALEFLEHLSQDWDAILQLLQPEADPGYLMGLSGQAGDKHRDGRSVLIAKFQSGWQVVYKPRSMAIDVDFQKLLRWLGDRCSVPSFRTLRILDRGQYGWVEFVQAEEASSVDEIERFYLRQGGLLALLYGLAATDFHFENVIAAKEHPVLLDLESLFQPPYQSSSLDGADKGVVNTITSSVLSVGLLPQKLWLNESAEGLDISGLGASEEQMSPDELPVWERAGTDEMRLTRRRLPFVGGSHRAILDGVAVAPREYTEEIVSGFREVYETLHRHRDELLEEDGPLARFRDSEIRAILRHTRFYSILLHEGFHPDLLRDGIDRDQHFDNLWNMVAEDPRMQRIIAAERRDLENGDIPLFTTRIGSRDLWTSDNRRIEKFFAEHEVACDGGRIPGLSDEDLARQVWFVRAAMASTEAGRTHRSNRGLTPVVEARAATRSLLLRGALDVGDHLHRSAIQEGGEANWIGLTLASEREWSLKASGLDLYSGLPGIALFLGQLGGVSNDDRYTRLARAATSTMQRQIRVANSHIAEVGAFIGWGGVLHALATLGTLWQDAELLGAAKAIVDFLPERISGDESHDIIGGSAGCLVALLNVHAVTGYPAALDAAQVCGDRLLSQAIPHERGIGWTVKGAGPLALTGFAHGAAGIGWALLKLALATGDSAYRRAAVQALEFERGLFCSKEQNWPDHRVGGDREASAEATTEEAEGKDSVFMKTWCNGAPGIGLGRADMAQDMDDAMLVEELQIALKGTLGGGFGDSHCLCHGDFGNLELLLKASEVLQDASLRDRAYKIAGRSCETIRSEGWKCGVPMRIETPGIMAGLAGIGYGQLRLAEPERVPSLLLLEAPGRSRTLGTSPSPEPLRGRASGRRRAAAV